MRAKEIFFFAENFGADAMLQRGLVIWELIASPWLHRMKTLTIV